MTPPNPPRRRSQQAAFTILEIMIALAIIGLLVGLTLTKFTNIFGNSQQDVARLFVNQSLKTTLGQYQLNVGSFPSTAEGLDALRTAPPGKAARWRGPYVEENLWPPLDPWGNPYQYQYPGTKNAGSYDLWSMGPDGQNGTADDIGNWVVATSDEKK